MQDQSSVELRRNTEFDEEQEEFTSNEEFNPLNEAHISSKPETSVLDELESFWEKNDASKGFQQRGILAEHIMEKQAQDLLDGKGTSKGKGAFCV